jgi:ElaB/YqjD/DUF883 family membrane-anchored ribosome-binding protein
MSFPPDEDTITETIREHRAASSGTASLCAEVEAYIATRPLRALAIALISGIVLGKLIL